MASVTVRATTPPQLTQYAFYGNASGRKIYVPGEVLNVYKNAEGWSDYADDIQPIGAVPYIDADGNMAYRSGCVEVTSDLTEFNDNTWYVVNSDVSMNGKLDVIGEANIILCDGATLNLNDLEGGSGYNQITIYGQSGGSGTLKSDHDIVLFNTSLIINGGTITVDKIIGHQEITIRRGNVTANSNDDGYAISSGKIIISGGSVPASITAGLTTSTDNDWTFNGTYSRLTYSGDLTGQHIFGFAANKNDATGVKAGEFVKAIDGAYFPAFRAYLEYTGSEESLLKARGTRSGETAVMPEYITVRLIGKNGEIDGIGEIRLSTGEVTFDSNAWYDLNGRRLAEKPTTKGIYINGGHKVVIK